MRLAIKSSAVKSQIDQEPQQVIDSVGNMEFAISSWGKVWCCAHARLGRGEHGLMRFTEQGVDLYIDFWAGYNGVVLGSLCGCVYILSSTVPYFL